MASPWIDVSVTLKTGMVHWPGDPPTRITHAVDIERGDPCTVSLLEMGAHTGTHMDAPAHFVRGGSGIDTLPLDVAIGSARVITIRDRKSIKPDELVRHRIRRGERVCSRPTTQLAAGIPTALSRTSCTFRQRRPATQGRP